MKKYFLLIILPVLAISCAKENPRGICISEAVAAQELVLDMEKMPATANITVSASDVAAQDVTVTLAFAPELVDQYNASRGTSYKTPVPAYYGITSESVGGIIAGDNGLKEISVVIPAGSNISEVLTVMVRERSEDCDGSSYCIPITIRSHSAGSVRESARTLYLIFRNSIRSKALKVERDALFLTDFAATEHSLYRYMTMEMMVMLTRGDDCTLMGVDREAVSDNSGQVDVENIVYIGVEGRIVRIVKGTNSVVATDNPLELNRWYHLAAVWTGTTWDLYIDGHYVKGMNVQSGQTVDLTGNGRRGSFQMAKKMYGYVSELRVWSIARTEQEIASNMYGIDPAASRLVGYWKMDGYDGDGYDGYVSVDSRVYPRNRDESGTKNLIPSAHIVNDANPNTLTIQIGHKDENLIVGTRWLY